MKITAQDNPQTFVDDVRTALHSWIKLANIELDDAKAILELLVVDKLLKLATPSLYTFIKQRKVHTEKSLVSALSDFKDSHPQENWTTDDEQGCYGMKVIDKRYPQRDK